jgi:hypothetical protein
MKRFTWIMIWVFCAAFANAEANPWVLAPEQAKTTISYTRSTLSYRQALTSIPPSSTPIDVRKAEPQIYLEYGYNERHTLIAKILDSDFELNNDESNTSIVEIGLRRDMPVLGVGLLPPFTFKLIDYFYDEDDLYRIKPASLEGLYAYTQIDNPNAAPQEISASQSRTDYALALSLGDKIGMGNYSVSQQIRHAFGGHRLSVWQHWEYKFEIGYRERYFIGQQTEAYVNDDTDYANLLNAQFVEWRVPATMLAVRYLSGDQRDTTQPYRFRSHRFEVRYEF